MTNTNSATDSVQRHAANQRFEQRFSSVDRIINPGIDKLELVDNSIIGQVAWTDGTTVFMNAAELPNLATANVEEWATILGANLHEIGHTFYSPREGSTFIKTLKSLSATNPGLKMVENLVEDQRQERLVIAQFGPPAVAMLTAATVKLVVASTNGNLDAPVERLWPLVVGRTWLPEALRKKARDAWTGDATKLAELVGRYQRLADPAEQDADMAIKLLLEILPLVQDEAASSSDMGGCGGYVGLTLPQGEEVPAETSDEQVPSAGSEGDPAEGDTDVSEGNPSDDEGTEGEGDDTKMSASSDESKDESGDGSGDTKMSESTEGDAEGESQGDGDGQSDTGSDVPPNDIGDVIEQMEQAVKDLIESDEQVSEKLNEARDAVSDLGTEASNLDENDQVSRREAPPVAQTVAWDVGQTLRGFIDDALPQKVRRTNTGRLNVKRWANRKPHDPFTGLYDKRTSNKLDDVSLDVTILIDHSSSMRTIMDKASEATWAVAQGVERAEGDCTVISYNHNSQIIRQTGEKSHPTYVDYVRSNGGTDPTEALRDTWVRLQSSTAANKVIVAITDGEWGHDNEAGKLMTDLRENHGVVTVGIVLGKQPPEDGESKADASARRQRYATMVEGMGTGQESSALIHDPYEIVPLFERVVVDAMREALV